MSDDWLTVANERMANASVRLPPANDRLTLASARIHIADDWMTISGGRIIIAEGWLPIANDWLNPEKHMLNLFAFTEQMKKSGLIFTRRNQAVSRHCE